ncbi:hypothetical protein ACQ4PT_061489 [Festuca glaucescens]
MASISEIKDDESCKLGSRISSANDHYAVTQVMKNIETRDINKEVIANFVDGRQEDSRSVIYDHQGSLINMNGPKRAILLLDTIVIEFDLKIKMGEQENDDLQLIDGLSAIDHIGVWNCRTLTRRIHGHCGAVDITFLRLHHSVEGTVEVSISDVQSSFSFCLGCFINRLNDEIRLFDGTIGEPSVLQRSVVAVPMDSWMELKFKVGSGPSSFSEACSFKANNHGLATQQIKTDFAVISVKVTWSTLSLNLETT